MTQNTPYRVVRVETSEQWTQSLSIRKNVFIEEQGYNIVEPDKDDPQSTHFLLQLESGESIGTVRVIDSNAQLGRFAILKPYRALGLGQKLIEAVHTHVRGAGGDRVWCQSQADSSEGKVDATGFYRRLGYVERGDKYVKEGALHQDMVFMLHG